MPPRVEIRWANAIVKREMIAGSLLALPNSPDLPVAAYETVIGRMIEGADRNAMNGDAVVISIVSVPSLRPSEPVSWAVDTKRSAPGACSRTIRRTMAVDDQRDHDEASAPSLRGSTWKPGVAARSTARVS